MTRLDCVIGSAAGQRAALVQAVHHARHRRAFGARLIDQPLMRAVLADLAVEVEAATALMLRLAETVDSGDPESVAFGRLAVAAAKFWVCKRSPTVVAEALECLGGNGYVEESGLPRLFRESPLNSIWEGSGNVIALDVLRAVRRDQDSVDAVFAELARSAGADARLDQRRRRSGGTAAVQPNRPRPATSRRGWPGVCRDRCWSASRRPRSPTRSARPAWLRRQPCSAVHAAHFDADALLSRVLPG